MKRPNGARSSTSAIPLAAGSKFEPERQHEHDAGQQHEHEPADGVAAPPALRGSRSHITTAPTSSPAAIGYDHELIAYRTPTASPAASASATPRSTASPRGPAIATCSAKASATTVNGSASTCACRSPSRNENHGNSLIVPGITREGANQS